MEIYFDGDELNLYYEYLSENNKTKKKKSRNCYNGIKCYIDNCIWVHPDGWNPVNNKQDCFKCKVGKWKECDKSNIIYKHDNKTLDLTGKYILDLNKKYIKKTYNRANYKRLIETDEKGRYDASDPKYRIGDCIWGKTTHRNNSKYMKTINGWCIQCKYPDNVDMLCNTCWSFNNKTGDLTGVPNSFSQFNICNWCKERFLYNNKEEIYCKECIIEEIESNASEKVNQFENIDFSRFKFDFKNVNNNILDNKNSINIKQEKDPCNINKPNKNIIYKNYLIKYKDKDLYELDLGFMTYTNNLVFLKTKIDHIENKK